MRYRALDASGDYQFGQGSANFLIDSPAAVAQSVLTRLRLLQGEWFLDVTEGTPWLQEVIGYGTKSLYDMAIRQRVLDTEGVTSIDAYLSNLDPRSRHLSIAMTITTQFSAQPARIVVVLSPTTAGPSLDFSSPSNSMYAPALP